MDRKTAEELGITQEELDDLVWVRDALDPTKTDVELPKWLEFDMHQWIRHQWIRRKTDGQSYSCGTAACIGGTMSILRAARWCSKDVGKVTRNDLDAMDEWDQSSALDDLFFNYDIDQTKSHDVAVAAIEAFLAGSDNPWGVNYR